MFAGYLKMSKVAVLFTVVVMGVSSLYAADPVITSTPVTEAYVNANYSYILGASDTDGDPLTWAVNSATTLPSWLSLSSSTVAGGNGVGVALNQLYSPNGVSLDNTDNVYVADTNNSRIVKWVPDATEGVVIDMGSLTLNEPDGINFDSAGNMYVADTNNHRIIKLESGATEGVVVAGGHGNGNLSNQLNYPAAISFDSNGDLYVADTRNDRIVKWASGATEGVIVAGGNGTGSGLNQLNAPTGICLDSANNLYIADRYNNRVMKWAPDANITTDSGVVFAGESSGPAFDQLNHPFSVSLDSTGNLYIADSGNHRIVKWVSGTTEGVLVLVAGGNGTGDAWNQLNTPFGLILDSEDNLYVADRLNHRVQKFYKTDRIIGIPSHADIGVHDVNLTLSDGTTSVEHNFQISVHSSVNPALIMYLLN